MYYHLMTDILLNDKLRNMLLRDILLNDKATQNVTDTAQNVTAQKTTYITNGNTNTTSNNDSNSSNDNDTDNMCINNSYHYALIKVTN